MIRLLLCFLFFFHVFSFAEEPAAKEETAERPEDTEKCDQVREKCRVAYRNLVSSYAQFGCNDFLEHCKSQPGEYQCKKLMEMAGKFKKFPSPKEFLNDPDAECKKTDASCSSSKTTDHVVSNNSVERSRTCHRSQVGPDGTFKARYVDQEMEKPFPVDLAGAALRAPVRGSDDMVKYADGHVKIEIVRDTMLASYKECLEKQTAAKTSEKEAFCQRLYTSPSQEEGGKGKMPAELETHLGRAFAAGISHQKSTITIEFWTHEGCKTELRKQDAKHGGVLAFFRPVSHNIDEVCVALIFEKVGDLWRFVTGSRDTGSSPAQMRGKFLPK